MRKRFIFSATTAGSILFTAVARAAGTASTIPNLGTVNNAVIEVAKTLRMAAYGIAVAALIYAGILYLTAYGDESKPTQAKTIFKSVAIGLTLVVLAQVIIFGVVNSLTSDSNSASINTQVNTVLQNNTGAK